MAGGGLPRQLKQFLLGAPLAVVPLVWASWPNRFQPCPANSDDRVLLMRCCRRHEPARKIRPSKEAPPRSHRAPPRLSRLLLLPACQMAAATLVEPAPVQSFALEIRVALLRQVGQPSLDGQPVLGRCAAVTEDVSAPGRPPRHRWHSRPCQRGPTPCLHTAGSALLGQRPGYGAGWRLLRTGDGLTPVNHLPYWSAYLMSVVERKMALARWSIQGPSKAQRWRPAPVRPWRIWPDLPTPLASGGHHPLAGPTGAWPSGPLTHGRKRVRRTDGSFLQLQGEIVESLLRANRPDHRLGGHWSSGGASMSQEGAQETGPQGLTTKPDSRPLLPGSSLARLPDNRCPRN